MGFSGSFRNFTFGRVNTRRFIKYGNIFIAQAEILKRLKQFEPQIWKRRQVQSTVAPWPSSWHVFCRVERFCSLITVSVTLGAVPYFSINFRLFPQSFEWINQSVIKKKPWNATAWFGILGRKLEISKPAYYVCFITRLNCRNNKGVVKIIQCYILWWYKYGTIIRYT